MQSSNGRPRGGGTENPADSQERHTPSAFGAPEGTRYDDPWYDALASGWGESAGDVTVAAVPPARPVPDEVATADVYLSVQRSAAFQEVRSRYRRFVIPAVAGFLTWYFGYVVAATTAPGIMARRVVGAVNVAMLAGLGQFLSTFLLTWAYVRHARLRRDRAALELRWDTQELARGARGGVS
ncbi:DUF485 domain-containing protein [Streptomyces actuosus]|uniref:DUF485 domain-containing protein n=1 Tax=Streptomyces actuosus TaxID=1885 RepID=A0ABS2VTN5_STRAS|nr:DUF485 domain-containing protein [Streptomyces actuosus]MBN0046496.1 DUF485 domain-containing protein [Streptomyces actuosus]